MAEKTKTVLTLSPDEALDFFMHSERYYNFELPEYFNFQPVLDFVRERVGSKSLKDCLRNAQALDGARGVNFDIVLNKDGKYAVRPLSLVNPYLYYLLVREMCDGDNWTQLVDRIKACQTPHITPCALPVLPKAIEKFHNSTTILNWWSNMEQRSISLSMAYRYMFVTDITNCYGSIDLHCLDDVASLRGTAQERPANQALTEHVRTCLRALQNGRNMGIPQGSDIFNLLAEAILCYIDLLLAEAIEKEVGKDCDYHILRYRDDYRVFCSNHNQLEEISYILQRLLGRFNFLMNTKKTKISESIITDSIKPDKQFYIFNTPIFRNQRVWKLKTGKDGKQKLTSTVERAYDFDGLQKNLLYILFFGRKFPDGGQIRNMLSEFDKRVRKMMRDNERHWASINIDDFGDYDASEAEEYTDYGPQLRSEVVEPMVAIAMQIGVENISAAHYALRTISLLLSALHDAELKDKLVNLVCKRFSGLYNSDYLQVWLQNITYTDDKADAANRYNLPLCRIVAGDKGVTLWNNDWLKPKLTKDLPLASIAGEEEEKKIEPVIVFRETRAYMDFPERPEWLDVAILPEPPEEPSFSLLTGLPEPPEKPNLSGLPEQP